LIFQLFFELSNPFLLTGDLGSLIALLLNALLGEPVPVAVASAAARRAQDEHADQ